MLDRRKSFGGPHQLYFLSEQNVLKCTGISLQKRVVTLGQKRALFEYNVVSGKILRGIKCQKVGVEVK